MQLADNQYLAKGKNCLIRLFEKSYKTILRMYFVLLRELGNLILAKAIKKRVIIIQKKEEHGKYSKKNNDRNNSSC